MVVQLAREGGRDAVFDVPARVIQGAPYHPVVNVVLASDPSVRATGRVREVAPQADPVTRTFRVRVGLDTPPAAMRLGSTVTGTITQEGAAEIAIPASALTRAQGQPAVWIVDPQGQHRVIAPGRCRQLRPGAGDRRTRTGTRRCRCHRRRAVIAAG